MMSNTAFSRPFDVNRIGSGPFKKHVEADESERQALVAAFELVDLKRLEADLSIEAFRRIGVRIDGRLFAEAVQACVITLEPVAEVIDHPFSVTFLPPEAMEANPKTLAEAEVIVVFDEDDPPDPLDGNIIDLGAILTEQLALALDPYPRAPGAAWPEAGAGDTASDDDASPFAALAKLRDLG